MDAGRAQDRGRSRRQSRPSSSATFPSERSRRFDLVDVVAGGDGFSGRRGRGINPTNGQVANAQPQDEDQLGAVGDGKYHRVASTAVCRRRVHSRRPFWPRADGLRRSYIRHFPPRAIARRGYVWAGGRIPTPIDRAYLIASTLGDIDYASPGHGLLFLHANKAVTFDLDAIRRANADCKLCDSALWRAAPQPRRS